MATTEDALALAALADNAGANVQMSGGWSVSPFAAATEYLYGMHGLNYTVYTNASTRQIVIAFGDNIDSASPDAASPFLADAALQMPSGASTSTLMNVDVTVSVEAGDNSILSANTAVSGML